jgi:hypothetical protein
MKYIFFEGCLFCVIAMFLVPKETAGNLMAASLILLYLGLACAVWEKNKIK